MNRGDRDAIWLATGPGLLTRALGAEIAAAHPARVPVGTAVLDRREVFRAAAMHVATGYKAAGRNWMQVFRRRRGRAKAIPAPA